MSAAPYIIEFIPQGRFVKVSAVDPQTGTEAVIVGDARLRQETLAAQAVKKLEFLLNKSH